MSASTEPNPTPEIIKLSIEDDEGVRATYPIIHEQIRVGRSEENEVCLAQRNISREHALLIAEPEVRRVLVHDLNSYTGIKLNGKRIFERCHLSLGDYLEIGGYVISLEMDGVEIDGNSQRRSQSALRSEVEPLPVEHQAKLVVVSNNLAGREYYLNRVEMLIGREQSENDLVINHRSISRNHAKIVWKNGEFTIFDLSSANGVLIGGSPFGAARLVRGSIIQMGHVKLRYVAPGEDYTFSPIDVEVTALDEPSYGRRIFLATIVFITIFFLSRVVISRFSKNSPTDQQTQVNEISAPLDETKTPLENFEVAPKVQVIDEGEDSQGKTTTDETIEGTTSSESENRVDEVKQTATTPSIVKEVEEKEVPPSLPSTTDEETNQKSDTSSTTE